MVVGHAENRDARRAYYEMVIQLLTAMTAMTATIATTATTAILQRQQY